MHLFRFSDARRSGGVRQHAVARRGILTLAILLICTVPLGGDAPKSGGSQPASENTLLEALGQSFSSPTDPPAEQAMEEIKRIRERLGGSVLRGSLLDAAADKAESEFDSGIRKFLGIEQVPSPSRTQVMSSAKVVSTLREHGVELDRIANEIEAFRQYQHADQLRKTATAIRLIARHLDAESGRTRDAVLHSVPRPVEQPPE